MAYTWTTGETITAEKLNATGGLPSVTSSDNGKVLSVVNGAWAADARGKVVFDGSGINKSFNDLLAMFNQGIIPWFIDEFEDDGEHIYRFMTCSYAGFAEGDYSAFFSSVYAGNQIYTMGFINSDPTLPMLFD